jgi:hypothetical protein
MIILKHTNTYVFNNIYNFTLLNRYIKWFDKNYNNIKFVKTKRDDTKSNLQTKITNKQ